MFVADTLIVVGLATVSLGTIQESDGVREQRFLLRNDGQKAVALMQGYTSCGCTTIHFDKARQLMPGDTASVTLRFNPRGKGGEFEETGTIEYGSEQLRAATKRPKRVSLSLTGNCITSEETLMRQFPVRINDALRLSTNRFDLGIMHVGETKERSVVILHRDDNCQERIPLRFTVDAKTPKGLQHIAHPVKVGKETIIINLDVLVR
jgi:hypothetical protein